MSSTGWIVSCLVLDIAVIVANITEQFLIIRKWAHLDRIDHILLSLSISDLISGIATLGIDSFFLALKTGAIKVTGQESAILVTIFESIFLFSVFASIFHIVAVAIERLFAVKFPTKYYIFTTFKFKCATIIIIWTAALGLTPTFSVIPALAFKRIGSYIRAGVLVATVIFVFVVYVTVAYLILRQRTHNLEDFGYENKEQQRKLKRLTFICLFIAVSFVICVLPITLAYFNKKLNHAITGMMITFNSFTNPCIYFVKVYYDTRSRSNREHAQTLLERRPYSNTTTTVTTEYRDMNENGLNELSRSEKSSML